MVSLGPTNKVYEESWNRIFGSNPVAKASKNT